MKILRCYYTRFIFITHIVHRTLIFLPSYINFCMITHKFLPRCAHCHHTHFIFTTKQSIFASFITRIVAKNISHAHYVAKLQTFLLDITNFLSITNSTSAFFIAASQCNIIFVMLPACRSDFRKWSFFCNSALLMFFCIQNYNGINTTRQSERTKNNILLQNNY